MRGLMRLRSVRWWYPRRLTTAAVVIVSVVGAGLAFAALPGPWRPSSVLWILPAAAAAYAALVIGSHKGWTKRFKHELLDAVGGDVDDATPWLLAVLVGFGFLLVVGLLDRVAT